MESTTTLDQDNAATLPAPAPKVITEPDFSGTPQAIGELTGRADYPQCLHGALIEIRGFVGVVVEIVNQSIKVRSSEGITQSFNFNRLKTLFAPPDRSAPVPTTQSVDHPVPAVAIEPDETDEEKPEAPARVYIEDPDFTAPLRKIDDFAGQSDFPQCAYGKHVDIRDFTGVVVEIVKGSLKIQSPDGITRSYNAAVLKKLYGKS